MRRHLTLRQIEAFKAVIEYGTLSRAAAAIFVTQPAMSKIIGNLEADADLVLFDRVKGRLIPTQRGMRLYEEIDRIFTGVRQVENAIDAIRREDKGRITIGVMPALSGSFVERVTTQFQQRHPQAFCVIDCRSSQRITEWLLTRKLDVGLVSWDVDNPYLENKLLSDHPVVCIMPMGHELAKKSTIKPEDLAELPFISLDPESASQKHIVAMLAEHGVHLNVALVAKASPMLCRFVAAGYGVSLVHPLVAKGFNEPLVVRPFEPAIPLYYYICRSNDDRNSHLVMDFIKAARKAVHDVLTESGGAD